MGEEHYLKPNKKIIKVRKLSSSSSGAGPSHKSTQSSTLSQINSIFDDAGFNTSEQEEEIQVIDLDKMSHHSDHPIKFLFPKPKPDGVDINNLTKNMPPKDLTKLLIGEKAQFTDFRRDKKRRRAIDFSPILEVNEAEEEGDEDSCSDESTSTGHYPLSRGKGQYVITVTDPGGLSADADISDDESEEEKNERIQKS